MRTVRTIAAPLLAVAFALSACHLGGEPPQPFVPNETEPNYFSSFSPITPESGVQTVSLAPATYRGTTSLDGAGGTDADIWAYNVTSNGFITVTCLHVSGGTINVGSGSVCGGTPAVFNYSAGQTAYWQISRDPASAPTDLGPANYEFSITFTPT